MDDSNGTGIPQASDSRIPVTSLDSKGGHEAIAAINGSAIQEVTGRLDPSDASEPAGEGDAHPPTKRIKTEMDQGGTDNGLRASSASEAVAAAASELAVAIETGDLKEGGGQASTALKRLLEHHGEMGKLVHGTGGSGSAAGSDLLTVWEAREASLGHLMKGLRAAVQDIRAVLEAHQRGRAALCADSVASGKEFGKAVVTYAHKICYTTFAPASENQANFRPPAPQEWQLMQGRLHKHAAEATKQAAEERAKAAAVAIDSQTHATATHGRQQQPSMVGARAAVPDDAAVAKTPDLPAGIPQMPPGWKPGDPIPGLDVQAAPVQQKSGLPGTVAATVTTTPSGSTKPASVQLGLLLDPSDMPMDEEDEYVSESESEDDSEDEEE